MADKKGSDEDADGGKKKKWPLLLVVGVLVLAVAGGAAFFLLKGKKAGHGEDDEEGGTEAAKSTQSEKGGKREPPVFIKLESFTIKLQSEAERQDAYLQATPELRVLNASTGERVKQFMPEIRHKVLLLMSGKKAGDLANPEGVQSLADEMRQTINLILDGPRRPARKARGKQVQEESPYDEPDASASVQSVLFTSFIVQ